MARKLSLLLAILLVSACFGGCNDVAPEKEETDATEQSTNLVQEPPLDELKEIVGSSKDIWGNYKSVYGFLSGDAKTMAECGGFYETDILTESDYEDVTKIKFASYEVKDLGNGEIDFKFTVSESESERFPVGEYRYKMGAFMWENMNEKSYDSKYDDILETINLLAGHGCTAWENGALTYDDNGLGFDFSVVRAIRWYANKNDISDFEGTTEDYAKFAEKLFGIKDFVPQSEYLKLVDGKWEDAIYINSISIMHSVTDIRENGDKIEIDIQYFADSYGMVPAHSVTVYATKTDDDVFKYYFEKSVVTETGKYKPLRWSV